MADFPKSWVLRPVITDLPHTANNPLFTRECNTLRVINSVASGKSLQIKRLQREDQVGMRGLRSLLSRYVRVWKSTVRVQGKDVVGQKHAWRHLISRYIPALRADKPIIQRTQHQLPLLTLHQLFLLPATLPINHYCSALGLEKEAILPHSDIGFPGLPRSLSDPIQQQTENFSDRTLKQI